MDTDALNKAHREEVKRLNDDREKVALLKKKIKDGIDWTYDEMCWILSKSESLLASHEASLYSH